MNNFNLFTIAFLALFVSVISLTITKTKAFSTIREKIIEKSDWLGYLFSCPYCLSHWVSLLVVTVYRPITVSSGMLLADLVVSIFVIVALATMFSWVVYHAYRGLADDVSGTKCEELVQENETLRSILQLAREKLIEQAEQIRNLTGTATTGQ